MKTKISFFSIIFTFLTFSETKAQSNNEGAGNEKLFIVWSSDDL